MPCDRARAHKAVSCLDELRSRQRRQGLLSFSFSLGVSVKSIIIFGLSDASEYVWQRIAMTQVTHVSCSPQCFPTMMRNSLVCDASKR